MVPFRAVCGDQRIFYAGSCAHRIQAGTTIIILVTVSFLTIPVVGIGAVPGACGWLIVALADWSLRACYVSNKTVSVS